MPLVHRAAPFPLAPSRAGDWVQNLPTDATAATAKWGDIGDWDVSDVTDFSYSFSKHRNAAGAYASNGNPKAVSFVGTAISKWNIASVTSLYRTFYEAVETNADMGSWIVAKATTLSYMFNKASKFAGTGLDT